MLGIKRRQKHLKTPPSKGSWTAVRCAPAGWCLVCCRPRDFVPSLWCCLPVALPKVALVGRPLAMEKTHALARTRQMRQNRPGLLAKLVRCPRSPQATTARPGLTGSKGPEGRTP